jgi:hypothetical protein
VPLIYLPVHLVIIPELILRTQCINSLLQGVLSLILPVYTADLPAGTFGSFPSIDGSAAEQAAFGGAAGGGLGSWGGMQAVGGIVNTLTNQLANREGTTAGQNYLDFMADKRDADAGAAVWERNADIADQFKLLVLLTNTVQTIQIVDRLIARQILEL